jgi:nucleotide-binding universal stress UspA family protein
LDEAATADEAILFTKIPYDNNYFMQGSSNLVIVSFYEWDRLTSLPLENGVAYFLASILRFSLPLPSAHDDVSGCINDFLWDKKGIDLGMRSGHICAPCKKHLTKRKLKPDQPELLRAIEKLLHDMAAASRNDENVVDFWKRRHSFRKGDTTASQKDDNATNFDVFLCHNSEEKEDIRKIARELESCGVRIWLDEEQLRPGLAWQVVLEEQINTIETAAVFVGNSGIGPWQNLEIRAFLTEFVSRKCPVIPVILPGADTVPELPILLRQLTWVDFREKPAKAMERLIWGITGTKP